MHGRRFIDANVEPIQDNVCRIVELAAIGSNLLQTDG